MSTPIPEPDESQVAEPRVAACVAAGHAAPLLPMARASRITLFSREVRERLSPSGRALLLERAHVLSEGRVHEPGDATGATYFGSTMLTMPLAALGPHLREATTDGVAARAASLAASDARLQQAARALATAEAERIAGRRFTALETELRVRAVGAVLQIDVDVEAALRPSLRLIAGGRAR